MHFVQILVLGNGKKGKEDSMNPMFGVRIIVLLLLLLLIGFTVCADSANVSAQETSMQLKHKLREGEVLEYRIQMSLTEGGATVEIEGIETYILAQVDEDSILTMVLLPNGTKMVKAQIGGKDLTQYATEEAEKRRHYDPFFGIGGGSAPLHPDSGLPLNSYLKFFQVKMRRNGEIVASIWGDFLSRHMMPASLGEWGQSFSGIAIQPWLQFPEESVGVGDTWTQNFGDIPISFTLLGFEEVERYRCAKIQSEIAGLEGESILFFAVEAGFLVKEEIRAGAEHSQNALTGELTRRKTLSDEELRQVQQEIAQAQQVGDPEPARADALSEEKYIGQPAPDFRLTDLSDKSAGLSDFRGKVVLLNFWVSWLPTCIQLMPHFTDLHNDYKDQGVAVVGVAFESAAERALGLVESVVEWNQIEYPILRGDGGVYRAYDLTQTIPMTFLIDREGNIQQVYFGYRPKAEFEVDIEAVLQAAPTPVEEQGQGYLDLPTSPQLEQNCPNPFNPQTTIAYDLPEASDVTLTIYTITGQHMTTLVSAHREPGHYEVVWDDSGFANGVYLYRLEAGNFVETRRMVLLK